MQGLLDRHNRFSYYPGLNPFDFDSIVQFVLLFVCQYLLVCLDRRASMSQEHQFCHRMPQKLMA